MFLVFIKAARWSLIVLELHSSRCIFLTVINSGLANQWLRSYMVEFVMLIDDIKKKVNIFTYERITFMCWMRNPPRSLPRLALRSARLMKFALFDYCHPTQESWLNLVILHCLEKFFFQRGAGHIRLKHIVCRIWFEQVYFAKTSIKISSHEMGFY